MKFQSPTNHWLNESMELDEEEFLDEAAHAGEKPLPSYYYIIRVIFDYSGKTYTTYKIGEYTGNSPRKENLIRNYTFGAKSVDVLDFQPLATDNRNEFRISDDHLRAMLKGCKKVDPVLLRSALSTKDGIQEFVEIPASMTEDDLKDEVARINTELGKLIKVKGQTVSKVHVTWIPDGMTLKGQSHVVVGDTFKQIINFAGLSKSSFYKKTVLVIGQFTPSEISYIAGASDLIIMWHDPDQIKVSYGLVADDDIIYVNTFEDIMNLTNRVDIIIANPPYGPGNKITKTVLNNLHFDIYVNLMPVDEYRGQDLFKYVQSCEKIESNSFSDAKIPPNTIIALLNNSPVGIYSDYAELKSATFDSTFSTFYSLNKKAKQTVEDFVGKSKTTEIDKYLTQDNVIYYGIYTGSRGFILGKNKETLFNVDGDKSSVIAQHNKNKSGSAQNASAILFLITKDKTSKDNLVNYLFNNPLANQLIKGLNSNGKIGPAIPNIDWSKPRDYEHLTLEQIIGIIKAENPSLK